MVLERKAFGVHYKDGGFLFSKFKYIFQIVGSILKVVCEVKLQLQRWNCCFDLVFNGGLSALLDSWPHMFCLLCVSLSLFIWSFAWIAFLRARKGLNISLSWFYHLLFSFCHTQKRTNHVGLLQNVLYYSKQSPHISHIIRWVHGTFHLFSLHHSYLVEKGTGSTLQSSLWWANISHSLSLLFAVSFINPLGHRLVITLHSLRLILSSIVQSKWKVKGTTTAARIVWFSWRIVKENWTEGQ